jgi:hypothetical protein
MQLTLAVILLGAVAANALAQPDTRNPQVDAATADAIESLQREIIISHITPDLTVADLVDRVGGGDELQKTIRGADQVGGPRWIAQETVQVRRSIDGSRIAKVLVKIAAAHPEQSPVPAEALREQLRSWNDRTFSATGTSMGAADVSRLRPPPGDRTWWNVRDDDRRAALTAARDHAVSHVIESLRPIAFDSGRTLNEALSEPSVSDELVRWLAVQPVKSVEFGDDLVVRLTLAVTGEDLWPVLKSALVRQKQAAMPAARDEWDRLQEQVTARVAPATGTAVIPVAGNIPTTQAVALPAQPPAWLVQQAEAEGSSPAHGSRLQTARQAEAFALEKLRAQINALALTDGLTVGAAARQDPRIELAVAKALGRARPFQVDYLAKGEVTVHVSIHLSDLWGEMTGQR